MTSSGDHETPVRLVSEPVGGREDAMRQNAIRAIVVSDVRLYREALAWRLAGSGRIAVLATADRASEALATLAAHGPDVVILDRAMPDALALVRGVAERSSAKVVAFAIADVDYAVVECAEAGFAGYVTRDATAEELMETVERAVRGEVMCSPRVTATLFRRLATLSSTSTPVSAMVEQRDDAPLTHVASHVASRTALRAASRASELTQREREIAALIERGLSNKEIASRLAIGTATVKNHVHSILEKLEVSRRGEAAASLRDARVPHLPRPGDAQLERQT